MSNAQAAPQNAFDISPVFKLYNDSVEAWKQNFDKLIEAGKPSQSAEATDMFAVNTAQAANLQKTGEDLFKRLVEQQIEICRFLGKRWEEYLMLPERLHRCKSLGDFTQVQTAFMNKMVSDYTQEAKRLSEPFLAMMPKRTTACGL